MTTTTATKSKNKNTVKADPKREAEALERLVLSRISLLMKHSFFGNLATRMTIKNADTWCDTCATDGRHFYYNTDFVLKLQQQELDFVFGHEVLHMIYDHIGRRGDRIPMLANIAADYVVNQECVDSGIGMKPTTVPVLYDTKYRGMSFEEVYEDLYQNAEKIDMSQLIQMMLDEHLDGDGDGDGEDGEGSGRPKYSAAELQQIKDEVREAMLSAAEAVGAGNTPLGVQRILNELTEPKMNWRELLQQQIESCVKSDFTWMKPSRRGWHCDAILPGMSNGQALDICVAIDTSGSIGADQLKDFLSEVNGIMQQFEDWKIELFCFDTEVHAHQTYTHDSGESLEDYQPKGGGGTSFKAVWEFMKSNDIQPKKLVFFSDGDFYDLPDKEDWEYCDVITIIHSPYNADKEMPYGVTVKFDK